MNPAIALSVINGMQASQDSQKQQGYSMELMKQQNQYNKESVDRQIEGEKELFNYTGPERRVEQLKAAGLNPGLIYGMGAGAGGTTGNVAAPSVNGQSAPNVAASTANKTAAIGMALQIEKLKSEIDVNKSVAEVNQAAAGYKSGPETELTKTQTQKTGLEYEIGSKTKEQSIDKIISESENAYHQMQKTLGEAASAKAKGTVDVQNIETQVKQYNENLKNTIADTIVKYSTKEVNTARIKEILNSIEQKWINTEYDSSMKSAEIKRILTETFNMKEEYKEDVAGLIGKLIPSLIVGAK